MHNMYINILFSLANKEGTLAASRELENDKLSTLEEIGAYKKGRIKRGVCSVSTNKAQICGV